jgi:hypothetical protein
MSDLITDHESRKPKMAFPGEQEEELLRFQHCGYANWQQLGCRRRRLPPAWIESKAVLQEVVGNPVTVAAVPGWCCRRRGTVQHRVTTSDHRSHSCQSGRPDGDRRCESPSAGRAACRPDDNRLIGVDRTAPGHRPFLLMIIPSRRLGWAAFGSIACFKLSRSRVG